MLVSAELVELWWNVSYALANPDGRHLRRVIGVNGTWPYNRSLNLRFSSLLLSIRPPPVDIDSTDRLRLHVVSSMEKPARRRAKF